MTIVVLNALLDEWRDFVSSIYGKKEGTPFNELWSLCNIEETRLKAKRDVASSDQTQAYAAMLERKGSLETSILKKRKKLNMSKIQSYECNEYGYFKRHCPKLKKDNKKRKEKIAMKPISWKK